LKENNDILPCDYSCNTCIAWKKNYNDKTWGECMDVSSKIRILSTIDGKAKLLTHRDFYCLDYELKD